MFKGNIDSQSTAYLFGLQAGITGYRVPQTSTAVTANLKLKYFFENIWVNGTVQNSEIEWGNLMVKLRCFEGYTWFLKGSLRAIHEYLRVFNLRLNKHLKSKIIIVATTTHINLQCEILGLDSNVIN